MQETKTKIKRGPPKNLGNVNEGPLDDFLGTNINQLDEKYSNKNILKRLDCLENEVKKLKVDNTGLTKTNDALSNRLEIVEEKLDNLKLPKEVKKQKPRQKKLKTESSHSSTSKSSEKKEKDDSNDSDTDKSSDSSSKSDDKKKKKPKKTKEEKKNNKI